MNRPALESLLIRVNEIAHDRSHDAGAPSMPSAGAPGNKGDVCHFILVPFSPFLKPYLTALVSINALLILLTV